MLPMLAACGGSMPQADSAGARLENAAVAEGLVVDPARMVLAGSWARDTDRLCVVGPAAGVQRIGVLVDYGEGQGCSASGTVRRSGERLRVDLGACRIEARFEGGRIVFPSEVPAACQGLCTGRASLAALEVEQLSASESEAATLRGRNGRVLCGG
jgi:hypothetical protein